MYEAKNTSTVLQAVCSLAHVLAPVPAHVLARMRRVS
jgi:hypothetical protein